MQKYGKNEEKGPVISASVFDGGSARPLPRCERCENKLSDDLPGKPSVCPDCGRVLMAEI